MKLTPEAWHLTLDRLATDLLEEVTSRQGLTLFETQVPELFRQIERVGRAKSLLKLWGESLNVDDNTGTLIVEPQILQVLSRMVGVPLDSPIVHAGIEHTYGYLLSLIETPYGKKRDRWVNSYLEQALGIPRPTFAPVVVQGTLLTNLTYFLGRILFRGRRSEIGHLRRNREQIDQALLQLNYKQMKPKRIIEEVGRGGKRIRLVTDLLRLPQVRGMEELRGLLIYGVEKTSTNRLRLITTFPVTEQTFDDLPSQPLGTKVPIQIKYNCHVEGFKRGPLNGMRSIVE